MLNAKPSLACPLVLLPHAEASEALEAVPEAVDPIVAAETEAEENAAVEAIQAEHRRGRQGARRQDRGREASTVIRGVGTLCTHTIASRGLAAGTRSRSGEAGRATGVALRTR